MELDNVLWTEDDNIAVNKLWNYLCTYCYLPRLADYSVLEEAIRTGLDSAEYFAIAAGKSNGRFLEPRYNQHVGVIDKSACLVKIMAALKQIAAEKNRQPAISGGGGNTNAQNTNGRDQTGLNSGSSFDGGQSRGRNGKSAQSLSAGPTPLAPQPEVPKNTHFFMSAKLDNTRINRDVQRLVEEVISHLTNVDGSCVEVCLEVNADAPEGMPQTTVRTVSENCQTLKVKDFGFDN